MILLQILIITSITIGLSRMDIHDIFNVNASLHDPATINQLLKCFYPRNDCTPPQQGLINYVVSAILQDCIKCNEKEKMAYYSAAKILMRNPMLLLTFLHVLQQYKPFLVHGGLPNQFNYKDNQDYLTRLILDSCHICNEKDIITYKWAISELLKHPDLIKRLLYGLSLYHGA